MTLSKADKLKFERTASKLYRKKYISDDGETLQCNLETATLDRSIRSLLCSMQLQNESTYKKSYFRPLRYKY